MFDIRPCLIFILGTGSVIAKQEIDHLFKNVKIVPQLIPQAPLHPCIVTYEGYGRLKLGEKLDPIITDNKPNVTWKAKNGTLYTIYLAGMTTEGEKVIPTWAPTKYPHIQCPGAVFDWRQWVVVNIPRNKVRLGDTVFEYMPPGWPKSKKGIERYVFLVYEQKDRIDVVTMRQKRRHLFATISNALDFAIEYDFDVAVAGNYFYTQRIAIEERKGSKITKKRPK